MTSGPNVPPAAEAWAQILAFVTGQDRLRALRLELDLGVGKSELLIKLAQGPMTLREVAQAVEVDPSAATVAVDLLERRGLVRRQPNPGDKRSRLVHLTDAGLRAAATARRILIDPPPALAALGADDIADLTRIFAALNDAGARDGAGGRDGPAGQDGPASQDGPADRDGAASRDGASRYSTS